MIIVWFRQDLRLIDNPAWVHALEQNIPILPIYIVDIHNTNPALGAASQVWLHHALKDLNQQLGDNLRCFRGEPINIIKRLCAQYSIKNVVWNRCYEPWSIARDQRLKKSLHSSSVDARSFNASLLWEPWEVLKKDGSPYKVFTPYYQRGCHQATLPRQPLTQKKRLPVFMTKRSDMQISIDALELVSAHSWTSSVISHWEVSEAAAHRVLKKFIKSRLNHYKMGRDFPAQQKVSCLAPYVHFGQISPHFVWYTVNKLPQNEDTSHFKRELAWREFSYYLLYHYPSLPQQHLQSKFDHFDWNEDTRLLRAWQQGKTGYPIVDAGMRELWQTGYMHNRIRMVVASFLVKNLRMHWKHGESWFWDCLFDADLANNNASWQWVAGCGADAAPYFRIFNPITQGEKFDSQGEYTQKWLPELRKLPLKYLFKPWQAPDTVLTKAGVRLGLTYPKPIVDLKISREQALEAFHKLKKQQDI